MCKDRKTLDRDRVNSKTESIPRETKSFSDPCLVKESCLGKPTSLPRCGKEPYLWRTLPFGQQYWAPERFGNLPRVTEQVVTEQSPGPGFPKALSSPPSTTP